METALKDSNERVLNHNIKSERIEPPAKRQRTARDFFQFCQFVLKYENYEAMKEEELRLKNNSSPMGSTADSFLSDSNCSSSSSAVSPDPKTSTDSDSEGDAESWDLITCYCMKPFAGRPMIECSSCLTWLHLSCAKVKRNAIPEGDFLCKICKDSKASTRRSERNQLGSRRREIV